MSLIFFHSTLGAIASKQNIMFWDNAKRSGNFTLTNGNRTAAQATATPGWILATLGRATGSFYFEIICEVINTGGGYPAVGLSPTAGSSGQYNGGASAMFRVTSAQKNILGGGSVALGGGSFVANDIFGCAVDLTAGKVWFAKNNSWYSSGNPAAGTNETGSGLSGTYYPIYEDSAAGTPGRVTLRARLSEFSYTPPSGFSAWDLN